jgi:hypothetical protein
MTLEACIAHAIYSDFDIIAAKPEVCEKPIDSLEPYIDAYITSIQQSLHQAITALGEPYIKSKDAAGLCVTCLKSGVDLPPEMLLKMCQTILKLSRVEARFIADDNNGHSLYFMKMEVEV